jgi:hypothetical protein
LRSNPSKSAAGFLKPFAYHRPLQQQEQRGGVVNTEGNLVPEQRDLVHRSFVERSVEQRSFTTQDILWAVGIWSAIIFLSPVIVLYMLMVA